MKIHIDRRKCTCWAAACETCFSSNYLGEEIKPNYCLIETVEDGSPDRTFLVTDRDGVDKILVVDETNWSDFQDAWMLSVEKETGELPAP